MHYIDEGPPDAQPVLLAHGEPTWGYLYRKMIPPLLEEGVRVVVPDLIGFGRSDTPSERGDYSYTNHVEWTGAFLEAIELRDAVLFGHDWGGLRGRQPGVLRLQLAFLASRGRPGRDACNAAIAPSLAVLRNVMIVERSTPACAATSRLVSSPVRIFTRSRTCARPTRTASRGAAASWIRA